MPSLRHLFRSAEIGARFRSYIAPIVNLFKTRDAPAPPTEQILTKELDYNSGMEIALENPDSLLWNKSKDLRFYDVMMTDDKIKSSIELKKRLALSSKGDVVPASEEQADQDVAEFLRWNFGHMLISFEDQLDNYLDAMVFGNKVGELMWMTADMMAENGILVPPEYAGNWFVGNIKHKHSVYFDYKYNVYGQVEGVIVGKNFGVDEDVGTSTAMDKFLIFTYPYPKDGNWYGDSDLKEVYPQWYAKFNIFRFRNQYLERYGMPVPEIIYDSAKTKAAEKTELKLMLKNFQESMYFLTPGTMNADQSELIAKFKLNLHEVRNARATTQYEEAIDQIDKQIARKLLIPDKLGFSETTTGSYSLGETQLQIFTSVIEDIQKKLENLVNRLIIKIVDFNFSNVKDYPTYQFQKISKTIKQEMLKILVEKGIVDKREKWIRQYVGIPEIDEKEREEIDKAKEEDRKNAPPPQFPQQPPQMPGQVPGQKPGQKFKRGESPVNFKAIERHYDEAEADFLREYNRIWLENTQLLVAQVKNKKIVEEKNLRELDSLKIKKTELKRLFQNYYRRLFLTGRIDVIEEIGPRWENIKKEGFKAVEMQVEETLDNQWVRSQLEKYGELGKTTEFDGDTLKATSDKAYLNAGLTEEEMTKTVSGTVYEGIRSGKSTRDISQNITKFLSDQNKKYATTIARTSASDFYNQGRMNLMASKGVDPYIEAFQYTAVIDQSTTEFCASHDGQIMQKNDPALQTVNPPNHYNCRSLLVPVFLGESSDPDSFYYDYQNKMQKWGTGVPVDARTPAKGFGG